MGSMTSWCPNCDDQRTNVDWSYYACEKCGAVVGVTSEERPMIAKLRIKQSIEWIRIQEVCRRTVPNLDMLS